MEVQMCEFKKKIPSFPNYEICPHGEILSLRTGNRISQHLTHHRYLRVNLRQNKKSYNRYVHGLVAETFLGPKPSGLQVDHIDGDKSNNHISNLRYVTPEFNLSHRETLGKIRKGTMHGMSKLTESQVLEIRSRYKRWGRQKSNTKEMSIEYGVDITLIRGIINRVYWKHL